MELDHFFILTEKFAPEAELLTELGLVEGSSNDHPGQGTANRRFFFSNTALELLYVRDADEADNGPGRGLRFAERASNSCASPFGLVMRTDCNSPGPPFAGWRYQPIYFDPGVSFLVAENSEILDEPLCICMPEDLPPGLPQVRFSPPFADVTELRIHVPIENPSPALDAISQVDGVQVQTGSPHLLVITFGHGAEGRQKDFRPGLPLIIHW